MAEAVKINFSVAGLADIERAFASVEKRLLTLEKTSTAAVRREEKERERAAARILKTEERARAQAAKAAERAEAQKTKAVQRESEKQERLAKRDAEQKIRLAQRTADAEAREAKRSAEAQRRETERLEAWKMRTRQNSFRMEQSLRAREARDLERTAARQAQLRQNVMGRIGNSLGGAASKVASFATGALAIGGGFALADSLRGQMSAEKAAVALSNSAFIPGQNQRQDPKAIMARASEVQAATGIDKAELIGGWQAYVAKSSDFKGGQANLLEYAKLAKGTNSNFTDVMNAAGILQTQNPNLDPKQAREMMRSIVMQGKLGAVELSDLATVAGKTTASSAMYQGDQATSQKRLLGLSQIAIKTAGSPEEAATAITRLGSDALSHREKLPGLTDAKTGLLKDPATLISEVMNRTGGHLGKINDLGFGERSIKIFEALAPLYQEAEKAKKGSGKEAVRAEVAKYTDATYDQKDLNTDFGAVMKTNAERFNLALIQLKETLVDRAMPFLERFVAKLPEIIPKVEKFIDTMGTLAEQVLNSPLSSLGVLIAGIVAKDIASAALGQVLAKNVAAAMSTSGGISVASAAFAVTAAVFAVNQMIEDKNQGFKDAFKATATMDNERRALEVKMRTGTATPEDIQRAEKLAEKGSEAVKAARDRASGKNEGLTETAVESFAQLTSGGRDAYAQEQKAQGETYIRANTALAQFTQQIELAKAQVATLGNEAANVKNNPARSSPMSGSGRDVTH